MEKTCTYFSTQPFRFQTDYCKIISGSQEGAYLWIASNYLNGNFANKQLIQEKSLSTIDLGGASVQISYLIDKNVSVDKKLKDNIVEIALPKIMPELLQVVSLSYLGYGNDEFRKQIQKLLL